MSALTAMTPEDRTRFLNAEYKRICAELNTQYERDSTEWWDAFNAHPTIQEWRADSWERMNKRISISKGH